MTEDFKCTLLNIWIMFIFPLPTWLLKCTNSYWQFNSNFKSSKCDPQTFPVTRYLPSKDTHTSIHLARSSKINQNKLSFYWQIFDGPLSKQKVWRQKRSLYFHLKRIAWAVQVNYIITRKNYLYPLTNPSVINRTWKFKILSYP